MYRLWGKRIIDVVVVMIFAPVWVVVLTLLAGLVGVSMGRPVIFRQTRPGRNETPFEILKLRTMTDRKGDDGRLLSDEDRLTALGRFLRRTSLDELPELINVLSGDMSLVGPRPLLMQYIERYSPKQARRHEERPGITGLAQVNGRNALTWEQKFEHDVWYVDNVRLLLDLKILFMTIWQVVAGTGVSAEGHATMPEFMGSDVDGEGEHL